MNNIHFQDNTQKNHYLLTLASFIISAAILLLAGRVLGQEAINNRILRSLFSCQAQGLGGVLPTIKVWYQQGTNLSFIQAGEVVKKVWLDDPSQVTLDFDGPVCMQFGQQQGSAVGDCENSGANVIHLRRIKKLNIPGLTNTDNQTLLTVVTEGQGKRKVYTFQVLYSDGAPEYKTLAIFGDPYNNERDCVRTRNNSQR
ncbi:hypothetical protein G7B40_024090 [Aetokthonos hydrillicola Thurmond2011]|jgi:hypothetical protein|uniref:Uncharacterized protein n=1 Tax=Aetokthonos hydrillicola Thurmond2011 TaxID=2712845 RepID=A0AAP5ICB0_9CYAN|nr:hypothetical protein [Aetokthonos hydrillicola]MBO3461132.1 hypothetical protein [Aetokthonos hydrillicola CCALA 1050]MBW4586901.1 hypothetical protein [Aetokthonos hydrillicola CCALA 1050]MDR9897624.1 hypothetical protein [Aetokthonos hydrillicola Thurmond2011]